MSGLVALLVACGSGDDGIGGSDQNIDAANGKGAAGGDEDPAVLAKKLGEKPWEVVSSKGETYLPNVAPAPTSMWWFPVPNT